jgi:hypothetical protein
VILIIFCHNYVRCHQNNEIFLVLLLTNSIEMSKKPKAFQKSAKRIRPNRKDKKEKKNNILVTPKENFHTQHILDEVSSYLLPNEFFDFAHASKKIRDTIRNYRLNSSVIECKLVEHKKDICMWKFIISKLELKKDAKFHMYLGKYGTENKEKVHEHVCNILAIIGSSCEMIMFESIDTIAGKKLFGLLSKLTTIVFEDRDKIPSIDVLNRIYESNVKSVIINSKKPIYRGSCDYSLFHAIECIQGRNCNIIFNE